jgi:NAD(P)-dependent dehydrogenase (short-subunit alcohol dehydrogenase family)
MQAFDLSGRVALVTGASSGLGAEFARALATAGARVVVCARRTDRLTVLVEEIQAAGGEALATTMDVTEVASVVAAFEAAEQKFGVVQILVNNAGISRGGLLKDLSEEDWDAVLETNLKSVWRVAREAANRMDAGSVGGSIINISSLLAFGTSKMLGSYMASKVGVVQLTRAMALEWADSGVRVNALAPGYFPTEMTGNYFSTPQGKAMIERIPQKRVGDPAELCGPLLLLASDASSYMTGSVITVDGGHLCQSL